VKAWIPFNAWYRQEYAALNQEREILDAIKVDGNKIRSRFIARLEGGDPETQEIHNHIAALHRRLATDPLADRMGRRIGFDNVVVGRNPKAQDEAKIYGFTYRVERRKNAAKEHEVHCQALNKSSAPFRTFIVPGEWDVDALESHTDYLSLDVPDRVRLKACHAKINPYLFRNLIAQSREGNAITMDGFRFIDDRAAIFAGLVDVLYGLRNLLFHGELVPDPTTNRTYEPAYHLLRHMIRQVV